MNKNPIVIQLIDSLNVGGAEVLAVNTANELLEYGIESHICATRKEGDLKQNIKNEVRYLFLDRTSTFDVKAVLKLKNYIRRNDIQVIHAHSTSYFIAFLVKLIHSNIKIVWHNHSGAYINLSGKKLAILKFISSYFTYIISVNNSLNVWRKEVLRHKEGTYLPNFPSYSDLRKVTKLKGLEDSRIVHLAGFRSEKDHLNLLKAFQIISKKHQKWTLHLIGKDYHDKYSKSIKEFIKKNQLEKSVFSYGVCSDINHIFSQATIGVLSSKSEGLPIALLEYGLSKLPVVVTDVGECDNVVNNTVNGLVVEPNNAHEFAKAVLLLIENSIISLKYGKNLYSEIQLNYSKENYIKQLLAIYKSE